MSRCIFRKTNSYQHWKLVPLIIIFASAVISLEQEPNSYSQWKGDSNQKSGIMLTRKD
jgi:hypothetical protein